MTPKRRLGILVASGPAEGDFPLIASALDGALRDGVDAALFLMDDGVGYALDARVQPFLAAGVEVALCAMDAESRSIDCQAAAAAGVIIGSQHDHARLLRDSDRFLSFT
jgi:sulfur relay (sulfurtransferase) complex TusBCD TusD component (DsrE family)